MSRRFSNYEHELLIRHIGRHGKRITLSDGSVWEIAEDAPEGAPPWREGQRVVILDGGMEIPAVRICKLDAGSIELEVRLERAYSSDYSEENNAVYKPDAANPAIASRLQAGSLARGRYGALAISGPR